MKKIIALFITLSLLFVHHSYAVWDVSKPESTDTISSFPTDGPANWAALDRLLQGYRVGCHIEYSSASQVTVTAGEVYVTDGTDGVMLRNTTSTTVTWSDIDTGSEASSTTYYVYAGTTSTSATTITFKISTSASSPSGLTYFKRLGSFVNNSSSNITNILNDSFFTELGDWVSRTAGVTYQATKDIFVVGYAAGNGSGVTSAQIESDSSSSPSTVRIKGGMNASLFDPIISSLVCPVKKGDYYEFNTTNVTSSTVYQIPFAPQS